MDGSSGERKRHNALISIVSEFYSYVHMVMVIYRRMLWSYHVSHARDFVLAGHQERPCIALYV